jgi:hypothetical protein
VPCSQYSTWSLLAALLGMCHGKAHACRRLVHSFLKPTPTAVRSQVVRDTSTVEAQARDYMCYRTQLYAQLHGLADLCWLCCEPARAGISVLGRYGVQGHGCEDCISAFLWAYVARNGSRAALQGACCADGVPVGLPQSAVPGHRDSSMGQHASGFRGAQSLPQQQWASEALPEQRPAAVLHSQDRARSDAQRHSASPQQQVLQAQRAQRSPSAGFVDRRLLEQSPARVQHAQQQQQHQRPLQRQGSIASLWDSVCQAGVVERLPQDVRQHYEVMAQQAEGALKNRLLREMQELQDREEEERRRVRSEHTHRRGRVISKFQSMLRRALAELAPPAVAAAQAPALAAAPSPPGAPRAVIDVSESPPPEQADALCERPQQQAQLVQTPQQQGQQQQQQQLQQRNAQSLLGRTEVRADCGQADAGEHSSGTQRLVTFSHMPQPASGHVREQHSAGAHPAERDALAQARSRAMHGSAHAHAPHGPVMGGQVPEARQQSAAGQELSSVGRPLSHWGAQGADQMRDRALTRPLPTAAHLRQRPAQLAGGGQLPVACASVQVQTLHGAHCSTLSREKLQTWCAAPPRIQSARRGPVPGVSAALKAVVPPGARGRSSAIPADQLIIRRNTVPGSHIVFAGSHSAVAASGSTWCALGVPAPQASAGADAAADLQQQQQQPDSAERSASDADADDSELERLAAQLEMGIQSQEPLLDAQQRGAGSGGADAYADAGDAQQQMEGGEPALERSGRWVEFWDEEIGEYRESFVWDDEAPESLRQAASADCGYGGDGMDWESGEEGRPDLGAASVGDAACGYEGRSETYEPQSVTGWESDLEPEDVRLHNRSRPRSRAASAGGHERAASGGGHGRAREDPLETWVCGFGVLPCMRGRADGGAPPEARAMDADCVVTVGAVSTDARLAHAERPGPRTRGHCNGSGRGPFTAREASGERLCETEDSPRDARGRKKRGFGPKFASVHRYDGPVPACAKFGADAANCKPKEWAAADRMRFDCKVRTLAVMGCCVALFAARLQMRCCAMTRVM